MNEDPPNPKPFDDLQYLLENGWRVTGHYTKMFSHQKLNGGIVLIFQEHASKIQQKWDDETPNI